MPQIYTAPILNVLSTDTPLRWSQALSAKNVSFGSRRSSCTAHKNQLQKCFLLQLPSSVACLVLCGSGHNILVTLHTVVVQICTCTAIMSWICKVNVLISLQFHQAFPWLALNCV